MTTDPAILKQADANRVNTNANANAQSNQEAVYRLFSWLFWLCRWHDFDQYIRAVFGSIATAGGIVTLGTVFGAGLLSSIFCGIYCLFILLFRGGGGGRGGSGGGCLPYRVAAVDLVVAVLAVVDLVAAV